MQIPSYPFSVASCSSHPPAYPLAPPCPSSRLPKVRVDRPFPCWKNRLAAAVVQQSTWRLLPRSTLLPTLLPRLIFFDEAASTEMTLVPSIPLWVENGNAEDASVCPGDSDSSFRGVAYRDVRETGT